MQPPKATRTVRKSDYTPALALSNHVAGILDEKCREKEKYREQHKRMSICNPMLLPVVFLTSIPNLNFLS